MKYSNLITKDDLLEAIQRLEKYIDFKLEPLYKAADDYYEFKDHVNKTLDWLVSAYKKFDDEHMILTERYTAINKHLETHTHKN